MLYVVRDVREKGSLRFQLLDIFKSAFQPQVGRVWTNAKAIEHQHFQITQPFECCRRNLTKVRRVSKIIEAISDDRKAAVNYLERRYLQIASEAKWRARNDRVRDDLRQAAAEV